MNKTLIVIIDGDLQGGWDTVGKLAVARPIKKLGELR